MSDIIGASIPVLRTDSLDYSGKGNNYPSYSPKVKILNGGKAEVRHKLEGECLVHELVRSGQANFGCQVIFKGAFLRETHIDNANDGKLEFVQTLSWNTSNASQSILFRPFVVAVNELETIKLEKKHNVTDIWVDQDVSIPRFALLADDGMRGPDVHAQSILRYGYKKDFAPFEMDVKRVGGEGKTYFRVYLGQLLYKLMQSNDIRNADFKRALMIHALSGAFGILQRDYLSASSDVESMAIASCDILGTLRDKLKDLGIDSWDEDASFFSPVNAATKFEQFTWSILHEEDVDHE